MTDDKRLIEVAFPLKEASLDSVHEKNVRHGHISTLHIWPARRPLAACRAALIATLLPDPGNAQERKRILERMAGRVGQSAKREHAVDKIKEETEGGILHWGRENGPDIDWFRQEIRKAHGGRAPKVLDPFAGGGAIPLEAMRLGCEVTAGDINPVAWFVLKCTLEYPQKLAGKTLPLPDFALQDREFMEDFFKAKGLKGARLRAMLERSGHTADAPSQIEGFTHGDSPFEADLAWQVRAWGRWVLAQARKRLAPSYPTYADFEPVTREKSFAPRSLQLLDLDENGVPRIDALNDEFDEAYLSDSRNPRWITKPTIAYLWARTVRCKQCRVAMPLLKTRWLCKTDNKRVLLMLEPNAPDIEIAFDIQRDVPRNGGNAAQRREHDKRIGAGTMSRTGAKCPSCEAIMTMADLRLEGQNRGFGAVMTAVVVDGQKGKEYRLPTAEEVEASNIAREQLQSIYDEIPFGLPNEPLPPRGTLGFSVPLYGFDAWGQLFTERQLLSLGTFVQEIRGLGAALQDAPAEWRESITGFLSLVVSRLADRGSTLATWTNDPEKIRGTFARFALPIVWDFAEACPLTDTSGSLVQAIEWTARATAHLLDATRNSPSGTALKQSAIQEHSGKFDVIMTDPPYYDAIPYSDLMDFFHVWLRRVTANLSPAVDAAFATPLGPKWEGEDGELIDDASRFDGDKARSRQNYEDGMAQAFRACSDALNPDGRMVIVFANKSPEAWETLTSALIRAGFVVDGSWPIQTERQNRQRSLASAALASSVWLVCRKRTNHRPGWDTKVLGEMRDNIRQKLRDFWDAGIRGPDFVWAATGPALEAYSRYPVVKQADNPGANLTVSEFLRLVRRIVVDFVVGRVLSDTDNKDETTVVESLDDITTYYLLHRHDFQMGEAPIGACILYALSCNLSDSALVSQYDLLARAGRGSTGDEAGADESASGGSGATVRLKAWSQRRGRNLGLDSRGGRPVPMIDQAHRLMHLWQAGDQAKVNRYLDDQRLKQNALFSQLLQALIELSPAGSDERSVLESLSNHISRERTQSARQGQLV